MKGVKSYYSKQEKSIFLGGAPMRNFFHHHHPEVKKNFGYL